MLAIASEIDPPYYTSDMFDRAAALRTDQARIDGLLSALDARFIVLWRRQYLTFVQAGREAAMRIARLDLADLGMTAAALRDYYTVFLGFDDGRPLFGIDLSPMHSLPSSMLATNRALVEFRPYEFPLAAEDAAPVAQFHAMANWRAANRFCGRCGAPSEVDEAGYRLRCVNGHMQFPRTDPVTVILICHGDRVLLARGTTFPNKRLFSALSGFVEAGETAEQTARREAFEEVGVRARALRYHSSQPWPFPGLVMMGFFLEAATTDLRLDAGEIAEARWFTRDDIARHEALGFDPPSSNMLAGRLLRHWVAHGTDL